VTAMYESQRNINGYEIRRSIKNNRFITLILILQCTVCLTLVALVAANAFTAVSSVDHLKEYIGNKSYYSMHDNTDEDGSYQKYRDSETEYYKLLRFVNELRQDKEIAFINTIVQPIDLVGKSVLEKFGYGYEEGAYEPYSRDGEQFFPVKCIQVSGNVFTEFGISVEQGQAFSSQDFVLDNTDNLKAVLGNEYKEYFKIGDRFEAEYLFTRMQFEVSGFLPPNTYIPRNGVLVYMDRYILIPAFSRIDTQRYYDIASIALLQQANGQIITSDKSLDVPDLVKALSNKFNTLYFDVYKAS
jgi:hypothetical protein